MATTMSSSTLIVIPTSMTISTTTTPKRMIHKVSYISGLNSFDGLKAHNQVIELGQQARTEQCFAKVVDSLRAKERRGVTCNAGAEIFNIAVVMNALTLVGVAVGFLLLRIEAFVEEADE